MPCQKSAIMPRLLVFRCFLPGTEAVFSACEAMPPFVFRILRDGVQENYLP